MAGCAGTLPCSVIAERIIETLKLLLIECRVPLQHELSVHEAGFSSVTSLVAIHCLAGDLITSGWGFRDTARQGRTVPADAIYGDLDGIMR